MSYTINGKEYDYNSITNQNIKERFVEREVICCDTYNVEYILSKGWEDRDAPFSWEDVENLYPDSSEKIDELQTELDNLDADEPMEENFNTYDEYYAKWKIWDEKYEELRSEIEELDRESGTPAEIYEWWRVTPYLFDKLNEHGEPVLCNGWHHYWGRCCTGQAILLDYVISEICEEMGILEGQEYSWERT